MSNLLSQVHQLIATQDELTDLELAEKILRTLADNIDEDALAAAKMEFLHPRHLGFPDNEWDQLESSIKSYFNQALQTKPQGEI